MTCAAGAIGVFLAIRCKAFFLQAWERELPMWGMLVVIVGVAAFAFVVDAAVIQRQMLGCKGSLAIMLLAVLVAFGEKGILLGRALEFSGMTVSAQITPVYLLGAGLLLGMFLSMVFSAIQKKTGAVRGFFSSLRLCEIVLFLGTLVLVNVLVWGYISRSSTVYYWDNAGYWMNARDLAAFWQRSGSAALFRSVFDSVLTKDYNDLIILPATIFVRLFGGSRRVFLLAIANFGFFPIFAVLFFAEKTVFGRSGAAAVPVTLAVPAVFYGVLIGFVDVAGCIFTLCAVVLYLSDRERNQFGTFLLAGLCLAIAVLLRRWYSFFAVSFVIALLVECVVFRRNLVPILGTVGGFAFILGFFFQTLVSKRLMADYGALYIAYSRGLDKDWLMLFRYYGIVMLIAAILIVVVLWRKRETRPTGLFLLLQPVICFAIFVNVQTHGQQHLLLYTAPLYGLLMCAMELVRRETCKKGALILVCAGMLCQSLSPLLPRKQPSGFEDLTKPTLLPSFTWKAPRNANVQQYIQIIHRLDELGSEGNRIGILASSFTLNRDILQNTEASLSLPERDPEKTYLVQLPAVDQRDGWSDNVFDCDILLVSDPIQTHLGEENQQVVVLPAAALLSREGFGSAFVRMEDSWVLESEIRVYLYRRVREITEDEKNRLRECFAQAHVND